MTYLLYKDIRKINDFKERLETLPEDIKKHVCLKKHELHLKQSITGWSELYKLVKQVYNKESFEVVFNELGKPSVKDNSFYFSISHSSNFVVIVISDNDVAVDVEYIKKEKDYLFWCKKEVAAKLKGKSVFSDVVMDDLKYLVFDNLIPNYMLVVGTYKESKIDIL